MNNDKTIARALALIEECIKYKVLLERDHCVSVYFEYEDGRAEWVYIPKLQAARDIVQQDCFGVLEDGIKRGKALQTINNCLTVGILHENEDGSITHCWTPTGVDVRWQSKEEVMDDVAAQETWINDVTYNVKSEEYLRALYNVSIDTEVNCPALNSAIFGPFDCNLLISKGKDDHHIYYFNADSNAGGQIVHCPFDDDMAHRMIGGEDWIDVVAEATQYLSDINTVHFFDTAADIVDAYHNDTYIGNFVDDKELLTLLKTII